VTSDRIAHRAWNRQGALGGAMWTALVPAALAYGAGVRVRNFLYDRGWRRAARVPVPVLSVGNLTVGGTGKTPVVVWLAEELERRGHSVGVLSRGYGRRSRGAQVVALGGRPLVGVDTSGDEPAMIGRRIRGPVVVASRRAAGARVAIERGARVLLLDDGFQHRAIARDFDLLLVDDERPVGNGWPLPSGPLREPLRGATRADAVLVVDRRPAHADDGAPQSWAHADLFPRPRYRGTLVPRALVWPDGDTWTEEPLARLAGQRILVVAGIVGPQALYAMVQQWEGQIVNALQFPDHHWYDRDDFATIRKAAREADLIVTTEKDLVKLERFPFVRGGLMALRLGVAVEGAPELLAAIGAALRRDSDPS
jgi:tetraacyldisaccharide 4'-kinase